MVYSMQIDIQNLPLDTDLLHQLIADLYYRVKDLIEENEYLETQLILLKAKRYGKSSEKLTSQECEALDEAIDVLDNTIEELDLNDSVPLPQEEENEDTQTSQTVERESTNRPKRKKLPDHLLRTTIISNPDPECPNCKGTTFRTLGEDISEILEYEPASFKVIRTVRPRCACTQCETIVQAVPPSLPIDKGKAGPGLLAHVILQKYGDHLPLYRQSEIFEREDIDIARSTLSGWVKQCRTLLKPLNTALQNYVFEASHLHGDDTPIKVLNPGFGKTKTGRIWTYVRDGRPWGDTSPPAVCYYYSPDRKGERPREHLKDYEGVFHADAYAGYDQLYKTDANPDGKIIEAACWAHMRRKFYDVTVASPNAKAALQILQDISKIYAIESDITGQPPEKRLQARQEHSKPLVNALFETLTTLLPKVPKKGETAKAITYALKQKEALMRFLDDGKIQIDNNTAERSIKPIALGRKNFLFAGSDSGGESAASMYYLIQTLKMNHINPWKYLHKVLSVIQDHPISKIHELLPWNIQLE